MTMNRIKQIGIVSLAGLTLLGTGCAQLPRESIVKTPEVVHTPPQIPKNANNGSIFNQQYASQPLFEDRRPRAVGDTITIVMDEVNSASKQSSTATGRDSSFNFAAPTIPTAPPALAEFLQGKDISVTHGSDFAGSGDAGTSNVFESTITVTVIDVHSNGNLVVAGEKQMAINQGVEYVRFSGVVNPRFITGQNTVTSTQVAQARMEYIQDGIINEAQTQGWLQRVMTNLSPF